MPPKRDDDRNDSAGDEAAPSLRDILIKTLVFTIAVVAVVAVAGFFFREPLTEVATMVVERLGPIGIFCGVLLADTLTFPVPPDTYLFVGIAGSYDVVTLLATIAVASVIAGNIAYAIGPYLAKIPLLRRRIESFRPKGELLFDRYGTWAVGIGALTPVPFSVVCWFAGIYRMKYGPFFAATLLRIVRIVGYFWLYRLGWAPPVV